MTWDANSRSSRAISSGDSRGGSALSQRRITAYPPWQKNVRTYPFRARVHIAQAMPAEKGTDGRRVKELFRENLVAHAVNQHLPAVLVRVQKTDEFREILHIIGVLVQKIFLELTEKILLHFRQQVVLIAVIFIKRGAVDLRRAA